MEKIPFGGIDLYISQLSKVIMAILLITPIFLVMLFIIYFSNMSFLIPLLIALYFSSLMIIILIMYDLKQYRKKIFWAISIGIVLTVIPTGSGIYHHTRPVVQETQVDLYEYLPFTESSKVATLDEPATFLIEDSLPKLDGATALYPIYAAFVQAVYPEKIYDPYMSEVMANRTGQAYENLIHGEVDMIFALAPSDEQLAMAQQAGVELELTPIAKEAFVFFVHEKNKVRDLSVEQLKGIYSGHIKNWKEVGGKNHHIRAFQREKNSGSQTALERFMGDLPIMDPPVEDIASLMGTMIDVVASYKNYPNAIGYTFRYYATEMVQQHQIRLLSVNGVDPTIETIRSGEYPIVDEIYAITAGSDNPHIESFINWILSEQGQKLIEETGYVPIR